MKTRVFIVLLLMLMTFSAIYASEDTYEQEEYFRKKQELDLLADRFKAETGFEGTIEYNYQRMNLSQLRGKFKDVTFKADQDTIKFRCAIESILRKVQPYIAATREQLFPSPISSNDLRVKSIYQQRIYGFSTEHNGNINVSFNKGKQLFEITDSSVPINVLLPVINISEKDAHNIALIEHKKKHQNSSIEIKACPDSRLAYSNKGGLGYKLVYIVVMTDNTNAYYVDVETGNIIFIRPVYGVENTGNVQVKGYIYPSFTPGYSNIPESHTGIEPLEDVEVWINNIPNQTDANGYRYFDDNPISNYLIRFQASHFRVKHSSDEGACLSSINLTSLGNNTYSSLLGDENYYAPSIHYHGLNYYYSLLSMDETFSPMINIVTDYVFSDPLTFGKYFPDGSRLLIKDGRYTRNIQHELSHCFVCHKLDGSLFFDDSLIGNNHAMDEAFANYLPCALSLDPRIPSSTSYIDLDLEDFGIPASAMLNEFGYADYPVGIIIADAWWALRSHFQANILDQILIDNLDELDSYNFLDLYKPRYFYNQLMRDQAEDTINWEFNANQKAIKNAYNSRGLHFYPKVESFSSANKARNIFGLNEPVHVKISDCPQNTRINIYVINHGSYTYTDGALVSALSSFYAHDFSPITNETTNASGEWSGLIWITPSSAADAVGDYDIIVDIGSPTTPDGFIHFAFSGANVMDGFDGRTKPGFSVIDNGIDVVLALDVSSSMVSYCSRLRELADTIRAAMHLGDRLNIFKFNEGTGPSWFSGGYYYYFGESTLEELNPANQSSVLPAITATGNTDIFIPYYRGAPRFNQLVPASNRPKGMVLLSDGEHHVTIHQDPNHQHDIY